jgi:hypothetical protein
MKRLTFLLLAMFLLGFNYGCSKKNTSEIIVDNCKKNCSFKDNGPKFCKRICEKEIFDPRWKFLDFDISGSAYFYDSESVSTSGDIVKVWDKKIYSERSKLNRIKRRIQKKLNVIGYENLALTLGLLKIDCSKKRYQILEAIDYASDGSVLNSRIFPENSAKWYSIPPDSIGERLFEEVCETNYVGNETVERLKQEPLTYKTSKSPSITEQLKDWIKETLSRLAP